MVLICSISHQQIYLAAF